MGSMKDQLGDSLYESRYPHTAGFKAPGTSAEAARKITLQGTGLRKAVFDALSLREMTADEVAATLKRSILSVRPRVAELHKLDLIEPTGERRKNESGMSADVWRVKV